MGYQLSCSCQIPGLGAIYDRLFPGIIGTFVDVGAYDGIEYSNTSALADRGWRGVCIEAVPEQAEACRRNHRGNAGVDVVNAVVTTRSGKAIVHVNGATSTADIGSRRTHAALGWTRSDDAKIEVDTVRLDQVLQSHNIAPGFEVLSIDTEGMETQVFDSFELLYWRPQLMIVELVDRHPDFIRCDNAGVVAAAKLLRRRIIDSGYRELSVDVINTVFER